MCSVKLKKERHPLVNLLLLVLVSVGTAAILYFGIPGTEFRGLRSGIYFPMVADLPEEARFMDNKIICKSEEALKAVQDALRRVKPDYPVESVRVRLESYPSGYKFNVRYATYYAQKFELFGEGRIFRKGAIVGDTALDSEVKARDDAFEKAIREALEAYFVSKGAQ